MPDATGAQALPPRAQEFLSLVLTNPKNAEILRRIERLGLPDAWLVSGCLFQTVWNLLDGKDAEHGIRDYDLFYFDPDVSWEAEDREIKRISAAFEDLGVPVEVRNQARVHLWYEDKFGITGYPELSSATDGIRLFLAHACMVAVTRREGELKLFAPYGLEDVFAKTVRPNPEFRHAIRADRYYEKAKRWQALWPSLKIVSWDEEKAG